MGQAWGNPADLIFNTNSPRLVNWKTNLPRGGGHSYGGGGRVASLLTVCRVKFTISETS